MSTVEVVSARGEVVLTRPAFQLPDDPAIVRPTVWPRSAKAEEMVARARAAAAQERRAWGAD